MSCRLCFLAFLMTPPLEDWQQYLVGTAILGMIPFKTFSCHWARFWMALCNCFLMHVQEDRSCDHHKELPWWVICLLWPLLVPYSRNRSHAVGAISTWKNTLLIQEFLGYTSQVHCTCHQPEWETSFWCLVTQIVQLKNKTSILENPNWRHLWKGFPNVFLY